MRDELIQLLPLAARVSMAVIKEDGGYRMPTPEEWAAHVLAHAHALQRALDKAVADELTRTEAPPELALEVERAARAAHLEGYQVGYREGQKAAETAADKRPAIAEPPYDSAGAEQEGPTRPDGPVAMREEASLVLDIEAHAADVGIVALRLGHLSGGRIGVALRRGSQEMRAGLERDQAERLIRWLAGPSSIPVSTALRLLQEEREAWDEAEREGRCGFASHSAVNVALDMIRNGILSATNAPTGALPAGVDPALRIRELEDALESARGELARVQRGRVDLDAKLEAEVAMCSQAAAEARRYGNIEYRQCGALVEVRRAIEAYQRDTHKLSPAAFRMVQRITAALKVAQE